MAEDAPHIRQQRQDVETVFQKFNFFPHLTVLDNLTMSPRKVRGIGRAEADALAGKYLERVRIP